MFNKLTRRCPIYSPGRMRYADEHSDCLTIALQNKIHQYFSRTTLLAQLCDQNGWMDEDSLQITLLEQHGDTSIFEIRFEEILKEGSGCECGRNQCWGKIKLRQSETGDVIAAQIIAGIK